MVTTRTRRKRRVGALLRALRERSGRSAEQAAGFLEVTRQTISRMESGETMCRRRDLSALVAWYGGSDAELADGLALWEEAKQDTVRVVLPGPTAPQLRSYIRAEADASVEKIIVSQTVHGLLQTYDYAMAIMQTPSGFRAEDAEIERMVGARISRQGRLRGPRPLVVHVVMDESVIRRVVGGPVVMRAQLEHLIRLSEQPHVTLQIAPFNQGAYGTMSGGSAILEFRDDDDPPAAYIEYDGGGRWVEDADDVKRLATTFDLVARAALNEADTVTLLRQQIEELAEYDKETVA